MTDILHSADPEARILFANQVDVRRVGLDGSGQHTLVQNLQYAVAVDYHYK